MTRLAARRARRRPVLDRRSAASSSLVVSVAAYDYLTSLLARYPLLGKLALVLTALLVARSSSSSSSASSGPSAASPASTASAPRPPPSTPPPTATPPLALSRRLARFYAGRAELRWGRDRLAEQRDDLLDADAILELTERTLFAPLDAAARREIEAATRTVAGATALIPLAFVDVLAALSPERPHGPPHRRDLRRARRLLRLLAAPPHRRHPPPRHRRSSRSATT